MNDYTLPFKSVREVLADKAAKIPDQIAFRFLENGETESGLVTYRELYDGAQAIAERLLELTTPGQRALLIYPSGIEFIKAFYGCVLSGVVAVPMYPPSGRRRLGRLENVARDCEPAVAMTTSEIRQQSEGWFDNIESMSGVAWLETDPISGKDGVSLPELTDEHLVFLQYTSGSTGNPKGVQVSHSNIVHNLHITALSTQWINQVVGWLPIYHDMGLIGQILYTVYVSGTATLMSPVDFIRKPVRWLQAITKYKAEATPAPNFAYDLCIEQITDEELAGLDLSCLKFGMNGAEPVKIKTLRKFTEKFGPVGFDMKKFLPCYGMAETTLMVSGEWKYVESVVIAKTQFLQGKILPVTDSAAAGESVEIVTAGPVAPGYTVCIVNPENQTECTPDQIGEVWVKGPCVARGYWERPDINSEIFGALIKDIKGVPLADKGVFLRTGDMGFMHNGALYISGRLKEMMIINGANHYPQDIEATMQSAHPALQINAGAVFSIEDENGGEVPCAFQEISRTSAQSFDPEEIIQAINREVTQTHELSLHAIALISPGRVPKTTSGKIQRTLCKKLFQKGEIDGLLYLWQAGDKLKKATAKPTGEGHAHSDPKVKELHHWMRTQIAELTGSEVSSVDVSTSFAGLGLSSIQGIQMAEKLSQKVGKEIPASALYDYFTITDLTNHLLGIEPSDATAITTQGTNASEPIAIIGMACKFPGADSVDEYWDNLINQVDSIEVVPSERWNYQDVYSETPAPDKMNTKWGGFMRNADLFDASFFSISPREAEQMDPQQRMVLEQTYTLFENAGYPIDGQKGRDVGVFLGISHSNYAELLGKYTKERNIYSATGSALSVAANRVSYVFDFQGPSVAVDTACSSSLVALHQAVKALRAGDCSMAVAGGVNLILTPDVNMSFSQSGLTAADGRCKTFDASADGIVRSEGCGLILLKPLSKAIQDGDNIIALVQGTAVNQDGKSNGLTAPNGLAQQKVIRKALSDAKVTPHEVAYVETHGTGTVLGDPIEVNALGAVYGADRKQPLVLGAVKANIGHLEAAAGIAGVIKAALALKHRQVPGQVNFKSPNPGITWGSLGVEVATKNAPLAGEKISAAVSSFGFGGTNAHVILGSAHMDGKSPDLSANLPHRKIELLCFNARDAKALRERAVGMHRLLAENVSVDLHNLAYTLALHKDHFPKRAVITASTRESALKAFEAALQGEETPWYYTGNLKLQNRKKAFLFTGAGAQYAGMGKAFYESEPAFAEALDSCFRIARKHMEVDLKKVMLSEPGSSDEELLNRIDVMQPAIFAFEYAMFKWWESLGIAPDMVIGHSLGEIVAACVSGVMSISEAMRLTILRGQLIYNMPVPGTMASIQAPEKDVLEVIKGKEDKVTIGVINGANQTVISGHVEEVEAVAAHFAAKGLKTKVLKIARAGHSPLMDAITEPFRKVLETFSMEPARIPLVSNVTGKVAGADISTPQYWVDHLRRTVRFSDGLHTLAENGCDIFLEMGPHPTLLGIARFEMPQVDAMLLMPSASEDDALMNTAHSSLGMYYAEGCEVDWAKYYHRRAGNFVQTPGYPFQRSRYWIEMKPAEAGMGASGTNANAPLITSYTATGAGIELAHCLLGVNATQYLKDHRAADLLVAPGALMVEMVLEYLRDYNKDYSLSQISLMRPLFLSESSDRVLQLILRKDENGTDLRADIHSATGYSDRDWVHHASAVLTVKQSSKSPASSLDALKARISDDVNVDDFYSRMHQAGMQYGPSFRAIRSLKKGDSEALAHLKLSLPDADASRIADHALHPALLDAAFQTMGAAFSNEGALYLPFAIENLYSAIGGADSLWVHVAAEPVSAGAEILSSTLTLWDEKGNHAASFRLSCKKATAAQIAAANTSLRSDWVFETAWRTINTESNRIVKADHVVLVSPQGSPLSSFVEALASAVNDSFSFHTWNEASKSVEANSADTLVVCFSPQSTDETTMPAQVEKLSLEAIKQFQEIISGRVEKFGKLKHIYWITTGFDGDQSHPAMAAIWGIGRTFMQEHPDLNLKLIDVDTATFTPAKFASTWRSLGNENQVRLSSGAAHALRIIPQKSRPNTRTLTKESTWLITGGLGDLGIKTAHFASQHLGIAHLVLTGRSKPNAEAAQQIEEIRSRGTKVTVAQCDIADVNSLRDVVGQIPAELPLKGVIHVAGLKKDALIKDQNADLFREVLSPKVQGTWNLHEATANHKLEVFTLYSSLTALAGVAGVANYAVGNLFLDTFAQWRARKGMPALSLNWGAWTNAGMLKERSLEDIQREMRSRGVGLLDEKAGMELFGHAIAQTGTARLIIAPIITTDAAPFQLPDGTIQPLYAELFAKAQSGSAEPAQPTVNLRAILRKAEPAQRLPMLVEALQKMVAVVVKKEDHTEIDTDGDLFALGIDSLMAAELVGKLSKALRQQLSPTILFDHRTINNLSEFLVENTIDFDAADSDEPEAEQQADISALSESESASEPVQTSAEPTYKEPITVSETVSTNGSEKPADWDALIKEVLAKELTARGKDPNVLDDSWSLRRSMAKLASLLNKRV